jgi:hypothetical protein
VGDQAPIPIESRVTREPEVGVGHDGAPGRGASSSRVVHEPGGWPRFAAVVAIAGLVAGGLVWALADDDPAPAGDEDRVSDTSAPPDGPQAATRRQFAEAMLQFGEVHSFAYRGSVHATATRPFGAGASAVGDLTVDGAVLLRHALAGQVAADSGGRLVETITSGPTVWTRTAADPDSLGGAPWQVRVATGPAADMLDMLDMQTLARLITTAGDPRGEPPDIAGRRVIRATLPSRGVGAGTLLPGADVLFSLDAGRDVAHVVVTWPARDPQLVLDLEIFGHNQPQDIAPPDRGPGALRRTVPIEALEAEGVRPLELGRVPAGWRLTGAWAQPTRIPSGDCSALNLVYGNANAGSGDYLWLWLTSARCGVQIGVAGQARPLRVGPFEGTVVESSSATTGALFDGTTAIQFETDLPVDGVATLLASLRPFDPSAVPEPLATNSSS